MGSEGAELWVSWGRDCQTILSGRILFTGKEVSFQIDSTKIRMQILIESQLIFLFRRKDK